MLHRLVSRITMATMLVLALLSVASAPSFAARQTFDFSAVVDENSFRSYGGPPLPDLYGEVANVTVSYDDSALVNGNAEISAPNLSVDMTFLGKSYDESDDVDYPFYPLLEVEDSVPVVMDLLLEGLDFGDPRILEVQAGFFRGGSGILHADIDIVSVPEPSQPLLALASLSTVAAIGRWRRMRRR